MRLLGLDRAGRPQGLPLGRQGNVGDWKEVWSPLQTHVERPSSGPLCQSPLRSLLLGGGGKTLAWKQKPEDRGS